MRLLYICTYNFYIKDGTPYTIPAYSDKFWDQYSDVFDGIDILGEPFKDGIDETQLQPLTRKDVSVRLAAPMARPSEFFNKNEARKVIESAIKDSECVLIKIISRKANLAIKLAKKYNKPYMIGVTGDLYRTLMTSKSLIRRVYAKFIYKQCLRAIRDCKFGTYVTQEYLQKIYPIEGEMCGFTDTIIPPIGEDVLENRIKKIKEIKKSEVINLGIIGAYHSNNKGHDTIIRAMSLLNDPRLHLRILGVGVKDDQDRWIEYGIQYNVKNIVFDKTVSGVEMVFKWIDDIDICLLPSRSEGLPRSIIEAISRACPCITSNVCGMPELVDSYWLHDPDDYEKLAYLLSEMLENSELMEKAAIDNFEHSKNYSIDYITQKRNLFFGRFKHYAELVNRKL